MVTDRLESMVSRGMISKKKMENRRIVQGKKRPKRRGARGTEFCWFRVWMEGTFGNCVPWGLCWGVAMMQSDAIVLKLP